VTSLVEFSTRPLPERWRYPAEREGGEMIACDNRFDDEPARRELAVQPRNWDDVVADTLTWLVDAGHLPARYRPAAADRTPVPT
jgi:hypothetical protein